MSEADTHLSQKTTSRILRAAGVSVFERGKHHKGSTLKQGRMTDLVFYWEQILTHLGLGMNRGAHRLSYGEYLATDQISATLSATFGLGERAALLV